MASTSNDRLTLRFIKPSDRKRFQRSAKAAGRKESDHARRILLSHVIAEEAKAQPSAIGR